MEVAGQQLVRGEVPLQDVEELHQPRGDILGLGEVRGHGQAGAQGPQQARGAQRVVVRRGPAGGVAHAEEARGDRVDVGRVEVVELALRVHQHHALQRLLGARVVPDRVVRQVVEHLERQEEARRRHVPVPLEDGPVDDLDLVQVAARRGAARELAGLQRRQRRRDLDDLVLRARVHVRVRLADEVEHVDHEGAVAGAHFVQNQVVVRVQREFVVCDQVACHRLGVVRPEELGGCVPELSGFVVLLGVQLVFEIRVPLSQDPLEFRFVSHLVELERFAGVEDDGLIGEVAILGVVEAICSSVRERYQATPGKNIHTFYEVTHKHLLPLWSPSLSSELIRRYHRVPQVLLFFVFRQDVRLRPPC